LHVCDVDEPALAVLGKADAAVRARITAENLLLRHQLNIARRHGPKRVQFSNWDRWGLVWVYRIVPDALNAVSLVRPETVIRWHRQPPSPVSHLLSCDTQELARLRAISQVGSPSPLTDLGDSTGFEAAVSKG
jgi:hypothetical protein